MIVESTCKRLIDEVLEISEFELGTSATVRGRIMRKATEQEYINDCLQDPTCPEDTKKLLTITNNPNRYWYEVHVD